MSAGTSSSSLSDRAEGLKGRRRMNECIPAKLLYDPGTIATPLRHCRFWQSRATKFCKTKVPEVSCMFLQIICAICTTCIYWQMCHKIISCEIDTQYLTVSVISALLVHTVVTLLCQKLKKKNTHACQAPRLFDFLISDF